MSAPRVAGRARSDADHRGIYGYSLSGGPAFAEGIGHLDTFHHIGPSSAAPFNHPSDADMFPNDGAEAKQRTKTLFISCGDADWDGFYPPNLATHSYCDAHSIPNYWLSVPGGGHDGGVCRPAQVTRDSLSDIAGEDPELVGFVVHDWNLRERARPATRGAHTPSPHAFRLPRPAHEHATALAHAAREPLAAGWSFGRPANSRHALASPDPVRRPGAYVRSRFLP